MEGTFFTVYTRTKAGVNSQVFTFARSLTEAQEKVEVHFAREHAELIEKHGHEVPEGYFGTKPLVEVTGVAWRDTFIP